MPSVHKELLLVEIAILLFGASFFQVAEMFQLSHRSGRSMISSLCIASKTRVGLECGNTRGRSILQLSASTSASMTEEGKGKSKKKGGKDKGKYSDSVFLPVTSLNQRANSKVREPELQKWWEENEIYKRLGQSNTGEKYILHDGPPYANGDLHIGHALNKILKDFINKYQLLKGRKVSYVPGWDCHGLPIELKVLQSMKDKDRKELTPIMLRKKAASFAQDTVQSQMNGFKRYGVWGDWENPYLTLKSEYEAKQVKVFGEMFSQGHIYRGKKPVHWSPSSRTALAEAELEYPDNHISKSIYVSFAVDTLSEALAKKMDGSCPLDLAIWTTTPWTIPANLGIAINPDLEYCIVSHPDVNGGRRMVIAKDLQETMAEKLALSSSFTMHNFFTGKELEGTTYRHPLYNRISTVLAGGDYITTDAGTGLVHTAPGHGQEDYLTGLKYKLPLLSPVNDLGDFTEEADEGTIYKFAGLSVLGEGNLAVIQALNETGTLLKQEAYNHKYPYDWRTKKPVIYRATEQWFASISTFLPQVLSEVDKVQFIPEIGRSRLRGMVASRGDWCISRQRSWGVPIPVFYNKKTNEALMNSETLAHIEKLFAEYGSDAWWEMEVADLLPESFRGSAEEYTKGTDTMDVWFDSGTSWAGVSDSREELQYPADLYLEGSDQHRGWFQSSMLTSVASRGIAPYKTVLTHGFVLDEKGYKMSKSIGNVVDPMSIIEGGSNQKQDPAYGADCLRLWVSGVDYSTDVCVGSNIIKQVSETQRKLRNTMRFLIGNLNDFDPSKDAVLLGDLPSIDRYILGRLSEVVNEVEEAYDSFQFYRANQAIFSFTNIELSSFYLDISKDRLYISAKNDFRRRACQTVIYHLLEQLVVALAPIVPHLSEDVWQNIPYPTDAISVFNKGWPKSEDIFPPHEVKKWEKIKSLRNDVNLVIERARTAKLIGSSQECQIYLHAKKSEIASILKAIQGDVDFKDIDVSTNEVDDLRFILLVSQVTIVDSEEQIKTVCPEFNLGSNVAESGVGVGLTLAGGIKCERCWYYSSSVEAISEGVADDQRIDTCPRCTNVLKIKAAK